MKKEKSLHIFVGQPDSKILLDKFVTGYENNIAKNFN